MNKPKLAYCYIESPVGNLLAAREEETLHYLSFPSGKTTIKPAESWIKDSSGFEHLRSQLTAYFNGDLQSFDLRLQLNGTEFQKTVWRALQEIPFGQTMSYGALAKRVGNPKASRAVGAANGANPIPIIIPCHRVIGSNKSLTGFGGGLATKEFLLKHEGVLTDQPKLL